MERVTLVAPDISCDHCIASIQKAVVKLAGVEFLAGDVAGRAVTLEYDPGRASPQAIQEAMAQAGYPVGSAAG